MSQPAITAYMAKQSGEKRSAQEIADGIGLKVASIQGILSLMVRNEKLSRITGISSRPALYYIRKPIDPFKGL